VNIEVEDLKAKPSPMKGNDISYFNSTNDSSVSSFPSNMFIPTNVSDQNIVEQQNTSSFFNSFFKDDVQIDQEFSSVHSNEGQETRCLASPSLYLEEPCNHKNKLSTRVKERKIGEVVEKVNEWRNLHSGMIDPMTGQYIKMSLKDAATRVGIKHKSLNDYLLFIKDGKKFGFNFNEYYHEGIGVLRKFVKLHKPKNNNRRKTNQQNGSDDIFIDDIYSDENQNSLYYQENPMFDVKIRNEASVLRKASRKIKRN